MLAVPREQVSRIHASSGTTGKPTVVGYTAKDIDNWADLVARSIWAAGGRPGDIAHVAYGYGLFTGGLGAHYGAERLGCSGGPMSGGERKSGGSGKSGCVRVEFGGRRNNKKKTTHRYNRLR